MPNKLDFIKEETGYLIKNEGEDKYLFEGIASSYGNEDVQGDVFEEGSLKKNYNKVTPMLINHSWNVMDIIGKGIMTHKDGKIAISGNFTKGIEKAETVTKLKNDGVPLKLSIGGKINKWEMTKMNGRHVRLIKEAEIIEVSVVLKGANSTAEITKSEEFEDDSMKKLDTILNKLTKIYGGK